MDGPHGIQLDHSIGATDRGTLWSATRQRKGDRIVRIVDPRFCDDRFRQSLIKLRARMQPRMLPIVGEGWSGVHFYIEYQAGSRWETLDTHFTRLHWRARLELVQQICDILPQWSNCPVYPLGLNGRNIIMINDAGRWFAWLLPCPALKYSSPCDLFGSPPTIISTLAPEIVRGVVSDHHVLESYALGTLAIHALGCKESAQATTDEQRVETQACGALLVCDMQSSAIEPFLQNLEPLRKLIQVIHHYTQVSPAARPIDAAELRAACVETLSVTDPVTLASQFFHRQNPHEALMILDWGLKNFGESLPTHLLAADICERILDIPVALKHLDSAVALSPRDLGLRKRRCDLRLPFYLTLPQPGPGEPDPEGDLLLQDLNWLKSNMSLDPTQKNVPYVKTALVYRHRRDLAMAAQESYQAAELEPADLAALHLYGECLRDLGDLESTRQVVNVARERIERMTLSTIIDEMEAKRWREKFDGLLQS